MAETADTDRRIVKASCLCGTFAIDIALRKSSLPLPGSLCHCTTCRRYSGALAGTFVNLTNQACKPDPSVVARLKPYATSEHVNRYFCPTCGCHVLWYGPGKDEWWLPTGCLEQVEGVVRFTQHIYLEDTVDSGCSDWIMEHGGEKLQRFSTRTTTLAPRWRKPQPPTVSDLTDRLHAHCSCGAINLYIARPSPSSSSPPTVPPDSGPPNIHENETWWLMADKRKYLAVTCTCNTCRLVFGFELIEWAFIPTSNISLDAEGKVPFSRTMDGLSSCRSSDSATRYFCNGCGASVFWDGDIRPGLIDVAVGLLDAPEGSRAESWLEWKTEGVSFREDAVPRATGFLEPLERELRKWGKDVQGRDGPHRGFLNAHGGNIVGG